MRALTEEAPARIVDLADLGVQFDDELGLEGGHSRRRVHSVGGAQTGRAISRGARAGRARAPAHRRQRARAGARALASADGRCVGVVTDARAIAARAVLLATGGYAALWGRTTNPPGSVGEGIAMAYRAGAAVADLEFVQFHPTALAGSSLLLSEALRGDGALLVDEHGDRFVEELAPRDVVARAIDARGTALLDLRPVDRARFPALMERIADAGFHPESEPVPVAPAAHYTMGGIVTDLDGATEVPGLYAAGECACTGVHGANRLASNSMLECLVFGRRAALAALDEPGPGSDPGHGRSATGGAGHAGAARGALGGRRPDPQRRRARAADVVGAPARVARRALRARARGEPRRPLPRGLPDENAALDGLHTVLRAGREPELEPWS